MKPFAENKYMLLIALTLAVGHAIPLYMAIFGNSSQHPINIFRLDYDPLTSLFSIAGISDAIAVGIAITAQGKGTGLRLPGWTAKLTLTSSLLYLLLLIGSLTVGRSFAVGDSRQSTMNGYQGLFAMPFTVIGFLILAIATGLIIRTRKKTASN